MRVVSAVAIAIVAVAAVTSADAGPPGSWTRLPGTVVNFAEPGLARTSDGVLHVLYTRKAGTKEELVHAAVSPAGAVGDAKVALGGWSSMSHPDVLRMPDGSLRVFFGGIRTTNPGETNNALNTAAAPQAGRSGRSSRARRRSRPTRTRPRMPALRWRRTGRRSRPGPAPPASASTME